jgi:hypothetical protein
MNDLEMSEADRIQAELLCDCQIKRNKDGFKFHESTCQAVKFSLENINTKLRNLGFELDYGE